MFLKLLLVAGFVTMIIFLSRIYPNIKKPKWQRKIVSADYLRYRDHGLLADNVLIEAIEKTPYAWQLYINLFNHYSTPWDMQKLYKVIDSGAEKTDNPGIVSIKGWCLMQEGEFEQAEEIFKREDVEEYMFEFNLPYLSELYFKTGRYAECEKSFIEFYTKIYNAVSNPAGDKISDEKKILADVAPDELVMLIFAKIKQNKEWKQTAKIIPVKSLHEEATWKTYYDKLIEAKNALRVDTGIYGPAEKMYSLKEKELEDKIETVKKCLGM